MTARNTTRVWTIQTRDAWEAFQRTGELRAPEADIRSEFLPAYGWMRAQMAKRIVGYGGVGWPIWLWVRWDARYRKPDLRASGHLPRGTKGARIELLIPSDQLLVSDFELWHFVLSNDYLALTEAEGTAWEARARSGAVAASVLRSEKERRWERIFDLTGTGRDPDWAGRTEDASLQAVTEQITLNQVVAIDHFVAR